LIQGLQLLKEADVRVTSLRLQHFAPTERNLLPVIDLQLARLGSLEVCACARAATGPFTPWCGWFGAGRPESSDDRTLQERWGWMSQMRLRALVPKTVQVELTFCGEMACLHADDCERRERT
jgi:hypothetical protein